MNYKSYLPWMLLLAMAVLPAAAQQVPIPPRPIPSQATRRTPLPPNAAPPVTGRPAPRRAIVPPVPRPAAAPAPAAPAVPLTSVTATNRAADTEPANISYNFPAVPVEQLLEIYANLVGRTLLRASSGNAAIQATSTVDLVTQQPLTRSEAIVALETVLGMNGITIVNIGDKFAKVVPEAAAPAAGDNISTNNNIPIAGKMVTQIVQVKYASLDDLAKVLQPFSRMPNSIIALPSTQTLILRDYAENVDRMLEMVHKIDVVTPLIIKPRVIAIKYALASDIASALSALGASGGTSVGKSSSGANFHSPGLANGTGNGINGVGGVGGIGGINNGLNGGGYPGQSTGLSSMASSATSGRSSFQQNLNRIVQNAANAGNFQLFGQTKIIADERTNSLLVFANDEDMKMIEDIVAKLDVVLPQVLIDAIVMEINLSDTRNTGVSYGGYSGKSTYGVNNLSSGALSFLSGGTNSSGSAISSSGSGAATLANLPGGFSYFGKFGNDLNVVLEAVATDSRINVLSRPRIQTSHAVPADIFIGETVPYVTGTYNYGYGSGPSAQYSQLQVGIDLQVLPLINQDGLVVMDIQADVEQIGGYQQIQGVGEVPTTTKRTAGAKVAVRDGETIMLGGFISDSRSTSHSGVPWLMNIPWLGNLFKSTGVNNARTELVMLLRPTVLPTPASAAVVATQERNKLAAVKQAEYEWQVSREERDDKIEAEMAAEAKKRAEQERKEMLKREKESPQPSTNAPPVISVTPLEDQ